MLRITILHEEHALLQNYVKRRQFLGTPKMPANNTRYLNPINTTLRLSKPRALYHSPGPTVYLGVTALPYILS